MYVKYVCPPLWDRQMHFDVRLKRLEGTIDMQLTICVRESKIMTNFWISFPNDGWFVANVPHVFLLTIGCWFSCNFSRSPCSKNSSATNLAIRCWISQGLAIALTSHAVIIMPHNTSKCKKFRVKIFLNVLSLCTHPLHYEGGTYVLFSPDFASRIRHRQAISKIVISFWNTWPGRWRWSPTQPPASHAGSRQWRETAADKKGNNYHFIKYFGTIWFIFLSYIKLAGMSRRSAPGCFYLA